MYTCKKMGREAENLVKEGLSLTKRIHREIGEVGESEIDPEVSKKFRGLTADCNRLLVQLRRQLATDAVEAATRDNLLRQTLKEELIDRDANAARVSERQRLLAEKGAGIAQLAQRSEEAIQQIDATLASLCPWAISVSCSVPMLVEAQASRAQNGKI